MDKRRPVEHDSPRNIVVPLPKNKNNAHAKIPGRIFEEERTVPSTSTSAESLKAEAQKIEQQC